MEKIGFDNIKEYGDFLRQKACEMQNICQFDFYAHYIDVFAYDYRYNANCNADEIIRNKAKSILKNGLYLSGGSNMICYTSMNGTSKYICSTQDLDVNSLLNYRYNAPPTSPRFVVLLAVPKTITYKGSAIDFSSWLGVHDLEGEPFASCEPFQNAYKYSKNLRHTKFSLLDCVLNGVVPSEFVLGVQYINPQQNRASFLQNPSHMSQLSEENIENLRVKYEQRLEKLGLLPGGENAFKLIVDKSINDENYFSNRESDDFD